jgi:hypothetical protein
LLVFFLIVLSTFIGGLWWELLVERMKWWSTSIRGAFAGLLTSWLSVIFLIPTVNILGQPTDLLVSNEGVTQELASVILASALAATFYFGPFVTFPVGIITGYALGKQYSSDS